LNGSRPLLSVIENKNESLHETHYLSFPSVHGIGEYPPKIAPFSVWIRINVGP